MLHSEFCSKLERKRLLSSGSVKVYSGALNRLIDSSCQGKGARFVTLHGRKDIKKKLRERQSIHFILIMKKRIKKKNNKREMKAKLTKDDNVESLVFLIRKIKKAQ